jgi:asparagine synthetase B (glutamine-hydrolysing)
MLQREEYYETEHVTIINQQESRVVEVGSTSRVSVAKAASTSRGVAVQIMSRIFKKNVRKCLSRWRKGVSIQSGGLDSTLAIFKERPD